MKSNLLTYINGGRYKGRKIFLPPLSKTRSTKSIIKESYFNTLQFEIVDSVFVEVFAGSGSIGLEALSRGAKKIYFIEKDEEAYKILQQNIKNFEPNRCLSFNADSFKKFSELLKMIDEPSYFYFDPPFHIRDGMELIYDKTYKLIEEIPTNLCKMITIEHISNIKMPDRLGKYTLKKSKKFGKTTLSYFLE